ncbi:MAG: hypothetical protein K940chlam8_00764 [Chlamydiae bacterium]|nr:hypothetical protein [Chlamydiota bacterium]
MFRFVLLILFVYSFAHAKIYDCFPFFNELELLDVRLHELDSVVDYFVLVEADKTFQGKDKPLHFEENKERFEPFLHKIIHIVISNMPKGDCWKREIYQRNSIMRGLVDADPDDIIMVSDVDEIPKAIAVEEMSRLFAQDPDSVVLFIQKAYAYYINLGKNPLFERTWTYCIQLKNLAPPGRGSKWYRRNKVYPPNFYRWSNVEAFPPHLKCERIKDGGWHFTCLGGPSKVFEKLQAWSHWDRDKDRIKSVEDVEKRIKKEILPQTFVYEVDETYPQYILDNIDYFDELGWIIKKTD